MTNTNIRMPVINTQEIIDEIKERGDTSKSLDEVDPLEYFEQRVLELENTIEFIQPEYLGALDNSNSVKILSIDGSQQTVSKFRINGKEYYLHELPDNIRKEIEQGEINISYFNDGSGCLNIDFIAGLREICIDYQKPQQDCYYDEPKSKPWVQHRHGGRHKQNARKSKGRKK